jgi:hypothetical protein
MQLKLICVLGCLLAWGASLSAQVQADSLPVFLPVGSMASAPDSLLKIPIVSINGPEELAGISDSLPGEGPYILVKRLSFLTGLKAINGLQQKIQSYQELSIAYEELEEIEKQRRVVFETIIEEEKKRAELFAGANQKLLTKIDRLEEQYEAVSEVSKEAVKGKTGRNIRMAVVGGVIGAATGALLGIIGTN